MNHLIKKVVISLIIITLSAFNFARAEDTSPVADTNTYQVLDKDMQRQIKCLAKNIYFEARGESEKGKIAVAQVTVNRSNHDDYPDSICEVVEQKTVDVKTKKAICQFSWACKPKSQLKVDLDGYYESYEIAKKVLLEGVKIDKLADALYFHSVSARPMWNKKPLLSIGNHVFYR